MSQLTVSHSKVCESLPSHVMDFLRAVDKDDTILVVSDCDKGIYSYEDTFHELCEFLLTGTHRMTVRVGGNSFRFAGMLMEYLLKMNVTNTRRFEFFFSSFDESYLAKDEVQRMRASKTLRLMSDFKFDVRSDFMRYVDGYDLRWANVGMNRDTGIVTVYRIDGRPILDSGDTPIRPSAMKMKEVITEGKLKDGTVVRCVDPELGVRGSLAALWVMDEIAGYVSNGEFHVSAITSKGAWAIGDVMMVKGYDDMPPATHALYSDVWSHLMPKERRLFEDVGLVCHHLLQSYDEADALRRKYESVGGDSPR